MVDLIEFPAPAKDWGALPKPGDDYQAFSPATAQPGFMLTFVFPNGSMTSYRLSNLERMDFTPDELSGCGDMINLRFANRAKKRLDEVRIEGRNLSDHFDYLTEHQLSWLRMLPGRQEIKNRTAPVITCITIPPRD